MADPYIPFGFNPPRLGPGRQPMPPLDFSAFMPPPTAQGGAMPQSPEEAMDLQQQGQGMMNAGAMALPFALAGPLGMAGRGAASFLSRYPMSTAAGAGMATTVGESTAAGPKPKEQPKKAAAPKAPQSSVEDGSPDPHIRRLMEADPVLRQLQSQIAEQEAIANAPARDYPKSARDGARARAGELTTQLNARMSEMTQANLPFEQAYPPLARYGAAVGLLGPGLLGYASRTAGNLASRAVSAPWRQSLRQADRALERGDDKAYEHFMARASRWEPGPPGRVSRAAHAAAPPIAGGVLGAELTMLPHQHNIRNAPQGSPQRGEAEEFFGSPWNWGPRAAFGFGIGGLSGFTGAHLPNISPGFRPPPPRSPIPTSPQPTPMPTPATPLTPAGPAATPSQPPGPGLAGLATTRRTPPSSPPDSPPAPAQLQPYQDAGGRWRVGNRWIKGPK